MGKNKREYTSLPAGGRKHCAIGGTGKFSFKLLITETSHFFVGHIRSVIFGVDRGPGEAHCRANEIYGYVQNLMDFVWGSLFSLVYLWE